MDRKILLIFLGLGLCWIMYFFISKGLQDKKDPLWARLDTDLRRDYQTLDKSIDPLDSLFQEFHQLNDSPADSTAFERIATPFLPTMEFKKFEQYVNLLKENKFLLISGVSGAGTSTLTNRLARFAATDLDNILEIYCAPQFDMEFYKRYIGERQMGNFSKGELLEFFDRCHANPKEKFVIFIDNLDKINPETFFGPLLWNKLDDPTFELNYNGEIVEIPDNFYLISVTHAGISSKIELNNEHFRRLGNRNYLAPDRSELIIYLRNKLQENLAELEQSELSETDRAELQTEIASLTDTLHIKGFIYAFETINQYIEQEYSKNHRLGQWSGLRKFYIKEDLPRLFNGFVEHVNALKPDEVMRQEDLVHVHYALDTKGLLKSTNFFAIQWKALEEKGFLTEFVVGFTFLFFSGIFSFFLFRRRQKYIKGYTDQVYNLIEKFENNEVNYEDISRSFTKLKTEVDQLIINKKINYSEASFFYTFIENKVKQIELSREVNKNFRELVETYMEDDILTEKEYKKLKAFLSKIKKKITMEDYIKFSEEIEALYRSYGVKK
jgi:hypothetical protein